jgi:predicted MFS family arabinose efflux permease
MVPRAAPEGGRRGIWERTLRGVRVYLATPRLRGLLALNLAAAAAGAMVIVNTVVLVKGMLGRGDADVGLALAFFGGGSMLAALALPRLLDGRPDRAVMQAGALAMFTGLAAIAAASHGGPPAWHALLAIWLLIGAGYSAVLTPSGRLLRRSAHAADRPSLFAAQFALSHACWLITYPLAGWLGAEAPMAWAAAVMAALAACGALAALLLWPARDPDTIAHVHDNLPENHPHLRDATRHADGFHHRHAFVIDDEHLRWPTTG